MTRNGFYEYNPIIYPRRVFVVIGSRETALNGFDGMDEEMFPDNPDYKAVTFDKVSRKDTGSYGCLVFFVSKKDMTIEVIAHEASHVVDAIEEAIGMDHGGEASAYLFGWVADSINKARNNIGDFIEIENDDKH